MLRDSGQRKNEEKVKKTLDSLREMYYTDQAVERKQKNFRQRLKIVGYKNELKNNSKKYLTKDNKCAKI